eukprot:1551855-Amphidinium_carterae.1
MKGSACVFFHPKVGRGENKCYNCGFKEHGIKDCTRARPTPQQLQKRGNGMLFVTCVNKVLPTLPSDD